MDIKATRHIIVGNVQRPHKPGTVVKGVDDAEAKALIAAGYATEVKSKGDAPENKANGDGDEYDTLLGGTVDEVTTAIDAEERTVEWLAELRKREEAGKGRKGILDHIDSYE